MDNTTRVAGEFVSILCETDPRPTDIETSTADDTVCIAWHWKKCQFTVLVKEVENEGHYLREIRGKD